MDIAGLLQNLAALDLFVQVQDNQLLSLLPALERADVRILIDHCGRPNPDAGVDQPEFRALLDLGRSGRAFVKLSGHVKYSRRPYPHADTRADVDALINAFTLDARVWGSDWPFLRAPERIRLRATGEARRSPASLGRRPAQVAVGHAKRAIRRRRLIPLMRRKVASYAPGGQSIHWGRAVPMCAVCADKKTSTP
jgi:Amidohydrolase